MRAAISVLAVLSASLLGCAEGRHPMDPPVSAEGKCFYDRQISASDPRCDALDPRPMMQSVHVGQRYYSTDEPRHPIWIIFLDLESSSMGLAFSHLPCLYPANLAPLPLVGVTPANDTVALSANDVDWVSADTTVVAFRNLRTPAFLTHYKRPGTVRLTATYRHGLSAGHVLTVQSFENAPACMPTAAR